MAHTAKLSALTDELVEIILGSSIKNDPIKLKVYRESALRALRSNNFPRTNQFDVKNQLDGLEEKFRVYNEDGLADALRRRLDELAMQSNKWTPEILQLLLILSDKPVAESRLESLDVLLSPVEQAELQYTWEDLAAEDPLLRDKDIWHNIDYGAESSDDERASLGSDLEASIVTETNSNFGDNHKPTVVHLIAPSNDSVNITKLEDAQFWRYRTGDDADRKSENGETGNHVLLSEFQAIREVLFSLSGLPNSLFVTYQQGEDISNELHLHSQSEIRKRDNARTCIAPNPRFALNHASPEISHSIMSQFAQYATCLWVLRDWIRRKQDVPLIQKLQEEVYSRLRDLDHRLSKLSEKYIDPHGDIVISLIELQAEIAVLLRPLLKTSEIIKSLDDQPYSHSFRYLELLYNETFISQASGDEELYRFIGTLFFDCFQAYIRPLRMWMDEGELRNDSVFFVVETTGDMELDSLWLHRFKLLKTANGVLHAPNFLHPTSDKIFTTGKSVVVLKHLRKYDRVTRRPSTDEPRLEFKTVCGPESESLSLAPFPELFCSAFGRWIESKHNVTSAILSKCLMDDFGLRASFLALESVYFMADGANAGQFANALFQKLDSGKSSWNDRFTLTELAQSTFGTTPCVTEEKLRSIYRGENFDMQRSRKSVKYLGGIAFTYSMPWPVQIVISKESISSYQRIFSFLLQIRRSAHMLQVPRLEQAGSNAPEDALYYVLRSRILWFTSTLYGHLTNLVFTTNISKFRASMKEMQGVDEMIILHQSYIKKQIDQSLLGSKLEPIHKAIIAILDLSIQLSDARTRDRSNKASSNLPLTSVPNVRLGKPKRPDPRTPQQQPRPMRNLDSSDEEDSDGDAEATFLILAEVDLPYTEQLRNMRVQFDGLCKFVTSGLRGVARAGGEPNWDMLADKLESGSGLGL